MSTTFSCGQCGAPLRPEQDWCSLCYAAVKPAFDPLTAPLDEVEGSQGESVGGSATVPQVGPAWPTAASSPQVDVPEETRPEETRPEETLPEETLPEVTDVAVMLSMLAAEHRQSDPTAGLAEHLGDRSTRMMVMFGGMLVIGVVGFLLLTVLGAIL